MFNNYNAACNCGSLGFSYITDARPSEWRIRKCTCSFCSKHKEHLHVSDPLGRVYYNFTREAHLRRYRFGTRTADFLTCLNCDSYLGAVTDTPKGRFAVLNAELIRPGLKLPEAQLVSFENESVQQRQKRRSDRWTPVHDDEFFFITIYKVWVNIFGTFRIYKIFRVGTRNHRVTEAQRILLCGKP